jgi:hypothetical protein
VPIANPHNIFVACLLQKPHRGFKNSRFTIIVSFFLLDQAVLLHLFANDLQHAASRLDPAITPAPDYP